MKNNKLVLALIGLVALIACNTITSKTNPINNASVSGLQKRWAGNSVLFAPPWYSIQDIAWKPDGSSIAVADYNNAYVTRIEVDAVVKSAAVARQVAWDQTGRFIAGMDSASPMLAIVDTTDNSRVTLGISAPGRNDSPVAWSPDGNYVVLSQGTTRANNGYLGNFSIVVWDVNTRQVVKTLGLSTNTRQVSWVADKILVVGRSQGTYNAVSGNPEIVFSGNQNPIAGDLSPTGDKAAIAFSDSGNERIDIFDTTTQTIVKSIPLTSGVPQKLKWNPAGTQIGGGKYDGTTTIWDATTGLVTRELPSQSGAIADLEWNPMGSPIAIASGRGLFFYDSQTGKETARIAPIDPNARGNNVYGLAFNPSQAEVLEVGRDSVNVVLDANTGGNITKFRSAQNGVYGTAYNPDGSRFVTAGIDGSAMIWDSSSNTTISSLSGHAYTVRGVAWSSAGTRIATASWDNTAKLWNPETTEEIATITHTDFINAVAFSPDSNQVATGSSDRTLKISSSTDGTLVRSIDIPSAVLSVAWNSSGTQLAVGATDKNIYVYDTATGNLVRTLTGHIGAVRAVLWSKDNTAIISGADDGNVKLWDASNGNEISSLKPASGFAVFALALSPDGKTVVAGTANGVTVGYTLQ